MRLDVLYSIKGDDSNTFRRTAERVETVTILDKGVTKTYLEIVEATDGFTSAGTRIPLDKLGALSVSVHVGD